MDRRRRWSRILCIAGLAVMAVGLTDPLEGSFVILAGSIVTVVGALLVKSRHKKLLLWSLALIVVGVAALWGLSSVGGVGKGTRFSSMWWLLVVAPYPVGFILCVIGTVLHLRDIFARPSA